MVTLCPAGPGRRHQKLLVPYLRHECRPPTAVTSPGGPRLFISHNPVSLHSRLPAAEALSFRETRQLPRIVGVAWCGVVGAQPGAQSSTTWCHS